MSLAVSAAHHNAHIPTTIASFKAFLLLLSDGRRRRQKGYNGCDQKSLHRLIPSSGPRVTRASEAVRKLAKTTFVDVIDRNTARASKIRRILVALIGALDVGVSPERSVISFPVRSKDSAPLQSLEGLTNPRMPLAQRQVQSNPPLGGQFVDAAWPG